ncbi:SMI1/KNR4 family protein [Kitasatospora sp. NA04385]|uniref:SMI1/KNR4 family protein n=1 Tax=Kitasatospora sp. NA04385 TaxID=2742135 RepID=UPI0015916D94|nr:SMI1/KNR4 family protein [Kitasatospora sp. NA04385]QKW18535.1 SMI1/KNR4 family protein [Kitasatospora sp. NA04385]
MNYREELFRILRGQAGDPRPIPDWMPIEAMYGIELPPDFKEVIAVFAPIDINDHLTLFRPGDPTWDLGRWMEETVRSYQEVDWLDVFSDPTEAARISFGKAGGLIPIAASDRGEHVFFRTDTGGSTTGISVFVGADCEFYDYDFTFMEWLYRYTVGEEVMGPNSASI